MFIPELYLLGHMKWSSIKANNFIGTTMVVGMGSYMKKICQNKKFCNNVFGLHGQNWMGVLNLIKIAQL